MADLISPRSFTCFSIVSAEGQQCLVEGAGRLTGFHHGDVQPVERLGVRRQSGRERDAPLHLRPHVGHDLSKGSMFGLLHQDREGPDERQARIDQGGELPAEDGELLQRHPFLPCRAGAAPSSPRCPPGLDVDGCITHLAEPARHQARYCPPRAYPPVPSRSYHGPYRQKSSAASASPRKTRVVSKTQRSHWDRV